MLLSRTARILGSPRAFLVRRSVARAVLRDRSTATTVDDEEGFAFLDAGSIAGFAAVLARAREVLEESRPYLARIQAAAQGNRRLTIDLASDELHARDPFLLDFCLRDEILLPVVAYLRTVPYLARLSLPLSLPLPELRSPSFHQRFHADNDDARQIKVFVNAQEVDAEDGPFGFLPARATRRVLDALRRKGRREASGYATLADEDVFRHADPSEVVRLVGPPGRGLLVDASRCLHFGSRVAEGRERFLLAAVFLRYHRVRENVSSQLPPPSPACDVLRRLVLEPPRRRPAGAFLPDPVAPYRASGGA